MANQKGVSGVQSQAMTVWMDVRSPSEYAQGHVPGALSLPLFSDAERREVGICYKRRGALEAVNLAWFYVGPKVPTLLESIHRLSKEQGITPLKAGAEGNPTGVEEGVRQWTLYCWRGGQRSMGMEMLVRQAGYAVTRYAGGYKAWRGRMEELWTRPWRWRVVGGRTGSAKTETLQALAGMGEQVLDLEALACHLGSAFGDLGQPPQPSQEHFTNKITASMEEFRADKPIWVESESRQIGSLHLPDTLYEALHRAPYFRLLRTMDFRMDYLLASYGILDAPGLASAFRKIERKMGPQYCKQALEFLEQGNLRDAAALALVYYDRTYDFAFEQRPCPGCTVDLKTDARGERLAAMLIKAENRVFPPTRSGS